MKSILNMQKLRMLWIFIISQFFFYYGEALGKLFYAHRLFACDYAQG